MALSVTQFLLAPLPLLAAFAAHPVRAQDAGDPPATQEEGSALDVAGTDHSNHGMMIPEQTAASEDHGAHAGHEIADGAAADQPGNTPPPPVPADHAADRFFVSNKMDAAREAMLGEMRFSTFALQVDRLEYRAGKGADGFGWEGQAWYGGDIDRVVLASEGEGALGERAERIELNAFWRRALDPWFNLQLGVRHDFRPDPQRTYALVGIEGLAPYWFELSAQLLVSDKGDLHTRGKAGYQQRITQSLVIEPEAEIDFAFQDVPALDVGSGFERIELGARLRYERNRSLAPYIGIHWERSLGETARRARASGDGASGISAVFGVRAMF
jgi:copper resistance protein B